MCMRLCVLRVVVSDEMMSEGAALNEAVAQQDADSSSDSKEVKQRSVSPTNNVNASHCAVSFDAQPVNFYLRLGAIGSSFYLHSHTLHRAALKALSQLR